MSIPLPKPNAQCGGDALPNFPSSNPNYTNAVAPSVDNQEKTGR